MTDYFALLGVPRRPWLDEDALKEIFHAKTLEVHPDTRAGNGETTFAELNDAYRTLRDPRLRLGHLLKLTATGVDVPAAAGAEIPAALQRLFPIVSSATAGADAALQKLARASSALSRGLLHAEVVRTRQAVTDCLAELDELRHEALRELESLNGNDDDAWPADRLRRLQSTFAYLDRWIAQLQEKDFQLSAALIA